ncbi:nuclear transport factor 2 family protein [Pedobacter sp. SYP-B3415]|uniref:YybH family protein n=1 Tax=Pedobacter sp. SYP-B3415 TaxID=2496641 RepID=UPI00101D1882|nr:nuclear transport factor 2 family protein [Pedobacter sp. SYP-B3415]
MASGYLISGQEQASALPSPLRAISEFYAGFNTGNIDAIAENWMQVNEAIIVSPVGRILSGWENIRAAYEWLFSRQANIKAEFSDYSLLVDEDLFYAVGTERLNISNGEDSLVTSATITRMYKRRHDHWKQIHLHSSIPKAEELQAFQSAMIRLGSRTL